MDHKGLYISNLCSILHPMDKVSFFCACLLVNKNLLVERIIGNLEGDNFSLPDSTCSLWSLGMSQPESMNSIWHFYKWYEIIFLFQCGISNQLNHENIRIHLALLTIINN